jgi:hypothetical protein
MPKSSVFHPSSFLFTMLLGCAGGGAYGGAHGKGGAAEAESSGASESATDDDGLGEGPFRVCLLEDCIAADAEEFEDEGVCGECVQPPPPPGGDGAGGDGAGGDGAGGDGAGADDPSPAAAGGDALASDGEVARGGGCTGTNLPPIPAGCTPVNGTGLVDLRWLECHRQAWLTNPTCYVLDLAVPNGINGPMLAQIVGNCSGKPTMQAQLECVGQACDVLLDGTGDAAGNYVCRHHAACVDDVLDAMGIAHVNEGSLTHAFTEVPIDTDGDGVDDAVMVIDAYNHIYYVCD